MVVAQCARVKVTSKSPKRVPTADSFHVECVHGGYELGRRLTSIRDRIAVQVGKSGMHLHVYVPVHV